MIKREIVLVGDKVLIEPDEREDKTDTGLYLPQGVKERERVNMGKIVKIGPGYPVADPAAFDQEPWKNKSAQDRYVPLQAQEGDYCMFLRDQGVEIEYEHKKYIVAPHSAILVLLRTSRPAAFPEEP